MCPVLAPATPDCPYPGIEAFRFADHPVFFAREDEAEKLLRHVTVYRGVLVYGPSGAGKSSLINAGFIPRALSEGFTPDRIRLQPREGQEVIIERIAGCDGSNSSYLPSNFLPEDDLVPSRVLSIPEFYAHISSERRPGRIPILIFDQFEEFVSLFEEATRGEAHKAARAIQRNLLDLLVRLHRDPDLRVKLIFAFREDYLAKLGKFLHRCPDLRDTFLQLSAPRAAALEQIILGPFRRFPGHFTHEFPDSLARRLEVAFQERCESAQMNLTEVQIVCRRLWLSADPEYEFAHKGLQGLLEDYLAESLGSLRPDLRDPAVALLSRMVTEEGLRNIISEDDLIARVASEERIRRERLRSALGSLVSDTRLVRRERREDVIFFEIVSEFLAPWIRKQKAVRHSHAQRRRWVIIAIALFCIAVCSLGITLWVLRNRTERAIARDEVKAALAAKRRALTDAQAAQITRAQADAALSAAIVEKNAAQKDAEAARLLAARVRPQLVLQAEVSWLTADAAKLRTENTRLAEKLRTAEEAKVRQSQDLDSLRSRVAPAASSGMRGTTAIAPAVRLLSGKLRPGEVKILTGPKPFSAGLACFVLESSASKAGHAGVAIVATTIESQNWSANIGKLSTDVRDAASRLLKDPTRVDTRNKLDKQLNESLTGASGIHRLLWSGSALSEGTRTLKFSFQNGSYELRVISPAPGEYEIGVFQIGSIQP